MNHDRWYFSFRQTLLLFADNDVEKWQFSDRSSKDPWRWVTCCKKEVKLFLWLTIVLDIHHVRPDWNFRIYDNRSMSWVELTSRYFNGLFMTVNNRKVSFIGTFTTSQIKFITLPTRWAAQSRFYDDNLRNRVGLNEKKKIAQTDHFHGIDMEQSGKATKNLCRFFEIKNHAYF